MKAIAENPYYQYFIGLQKFAEMSVHGSGIGFIPETSHCGCAVEIQ